MLREYSQWGIRGDARCEKTMGSRYDQIGVDQVNLKNVHWTMNITWIFLNATERWNSLESLNIAGYHLHGWTKYTFLDIKLTAMSHDVRILYCARYKISYLDLLRTGFDWAWFSEPESVRVSPNFNRLGAMLNMARQSVWSVCRRSSDPVMCSESCR